MARKIPWSQRVTQKDKQFLDSVFDAYRVEKGIKTKAEAFVHFVRNRVGEVQGESDAFIPELFYPDEKEFEATCPFCFLRLISDSYGREELWHCLKQQGLHNKGKPVLLANGKDKKSIRAICEACQINWQRGPKNLEKVRIAFQELGGQEVTSTLYFCVRDALGEGIKLSPTKHGSFFCVERRRKVIVKNTCVEKKCPYLVMKPISLDLSETIPFSEGRKALEAL